MPDLDALAARHGLPPDAVQHLLEALVHGGGRQAQFDHAALGGMGQWTAGGMTMIGAMFNDALKAKVAVLCADLAPLARGTAGQRGDARGDASWPDGLGSPSSCGAQNAIRYAVFPKARRLAVEDAGGVTLYDTGEHRISGVSQQQSVGRNLSFTSQLGTVRLHDLKAVGKAGASPEPPGGRSTSSAALSAPEGIPGLIERLGELHAKGHLTAAEFASKKAELLGRL